MSGVPAVLRHRFDPARERVTLRVRPARSALTDDFELSLGEARRLAWAMLADIDPDEVEAIGAAEGEASLGSPTSGQPTGRGAAPLGRRLCDCSLAEGPRAPGGKAWEILQALGRRNLTAREAGKVIDRDTSTASAFLVGLVRTGMAEVVSGGMFGEPRVYAATKHGQYALRLKRHRQRAPAEL